jgi:hypothetical protein
MQPELALPLFANASFALPTATANAIVIATLTPNATNAGCGASSAFALTFMPIVLTIFASLLFNVWL